MKRVLKAFVCLAVALSLTNLPAISLTVPDADPTPIPVAEPVPTSTSTPKPAAESTPTPVSMLKSTPLSVKEPTISTSVSKDGVRVTVDGIETYVPFSKENSEKWLVRLDDIYHADGSQTLMYVNCGDKTTVYLWDYDHTYTKSGEAAAMPMEIFVDGVSVYSKKNSRYLGGTKKNPMNGEEYDKSFTVPKGGLVTTKCLPLSSESYRYDSGDGSYTVRSFLVSDKSTVWS